MANPSRPSVKFTDPDILSNEPDFANTVPHFFTPVPKLNAPSISGIKLEVNSEFLQKPIKQS